MSTELLETLQQRTTDGILKRQEELSALQRRKDDQKLVEDMQRAEQIIMCLEETLTKAADAGESKCQIIDDIDVWHPDAVKKVELALTDHRLKVEHVPEYDAGRESSWTELWASW